MADIALPAFTDGTVANAADIDEVFYTDVLADFGVSMVMANGLLEAANLAPSLEITAEMTQRGCMVDLSGSSGTANLDYARYWYGGYVYPGGYDFVYSDLDPHKRIPGGCHTFHMRWAGLALINWSCFVEWDAADSTDKLILTALVDNEYVQHRRVGNTIVGGSVYGYQNSRVWSGHYLATLTQGWHNFELAILVPTVKQGRIHSVSVDVLPMKYGAAT